MPEKGDVDILANTDKEKIQRLEARITTSNGSSKAVLTSVGFPLSSSSPSSSAFPTTSASSFQHGAPSSPFPGSNSSAVSRTVPGIERVQQQPPQSHHQAESVPDSPNDVGYVGNRVEGARENDTYASNSLERRASLGTPGNAWTGKRRLEYTIGDSREAPARRRLEAGEMDRQGEPLQQKRKVSESFSLEEDSAIMNTMFFERTGTAWADLSVKLNRSEKEIKERYRILINQAARVDSMDRQNFGALDALSRNNSFSRSAISNTSSESNSRSGERTAPLGGGGESTPNRNKSRASASSPTQTGSAIKTALKNQPQIKQFFVPVATSSSSGSRKSFSQVSRSVSMSNIPTSPGTRLGESPPSALKQHHSALDLTCPMEASSTTVEEQHVSLTLDSFSDVDPPYKPLEESKSNDANSRQHIGVVANRIAMHDERRELEYTLREKEREVEKLSKSLEEKNALLAREKHHVDVLTIENKDLKQRVSTLENEAEERKNRVAKVLEELLRRTDAELHRFQRKRLTEESYRLGRISVQKHGFGPRSRLAEIWEDGEAFRSVRAKQLDLLQRREELEKRRKQVSKVSRQRKSVVANSDESVFAELEEMESEEAIKAEMNALKRREQELGEERNKLEVDKIFHIRNFKRLREEDGSRFNRQPVLHNRYLLRELLGKGGFSEVWKAYDLVELRDVAVKVHELNSNWSEEKKANYLKHATREYNIHLSLVHPRIVQLFDVFEIDPNSFATVLEFCRGTDLEVHLKLRKMLPEREARAILLQILSGLRYLASGGELAHEEDYVEGTASGAPKSSVQEQRPCIIHYDLKPGNILFDGAGNVKITDFGLSKIMDPVAAESTGIELTSQGAGTYWYLPPECFRVGGAPPKISSKVDVWSTGVIFYQMLYGARPFGEGMSQERVYQDQTMLKATQVSFPAKPQVSNEAKNFIRKCLTYRQEFRPDVKTLCQDPYLRQKKLSS